MRTNTRSSAQPPMALSSFVWITSVRKIKGSRHHARALRLAGGAGAATFCFLLPAQALWRCMNPFKQRLKACNTVTTCVRRRTYRGAILCVRHGGCGHISYGQGSVEAQNRQCVPERHHSIIRWGHAERAAQCQSVSGRHAKRAKSGGDAAASLDLLPAEVKGRREASRI